MKLVPSAVCLLMMMAMSVHSQIQQCEDAIELVPVEGEVQQSASLKISSSTTHYTMMYRNLRLE